MPNGAICVKLIELGQEIKEFDISEDPCVSKLFEVAGKSFSADAAITRRGIKIDSYTQLYDEDKVFVGKKTKGNLEPFEVSFIRMGAGGGIINLPAEDGDTIEKVLGQLEDEQRKSYYRADGTPAYEYRIGTSKVEGSHELRRPSGSASLRIILSQKIKGNDEA